MSSRAVTACNYIPLLAAPLSLMPGSYIFISMLSLMNANVIQAEA